MRRPLLIVVLAAACAAPADGRQTSAERPPPPDAPGTIPPFVTAKAEALLDERLPCLGCHRLNGRGGAIGPDLTTVGARRSRSEIERMIRDPQGTVPGTLMPRVPMPDDWVVLLADYLSDTRDPPRDAAGPAAAFSDADPEPASGSPAQLYALRCAACHGSAGQGDGPNAENLPVRPTAHADAQVMSLRPDDSLYDAIAGGGWIMGKSARMPPFGETLAPDDVRGLVRYIRTLCECEGPPWSRDGARFGEAR